MESWLDRKKEKKSFFFSLSVFFFVFFCLLHHMTQPLKISGRVNGVLYHEAGGAPTWLPFPMDLDEQFAQTQEIIQAHDGCTSSLTIILNRNATNMTYLTATVDDSGILHGLPPNASLPPRHDGSRLHGRVVLLKARDVYPNDVFEALDVTPADLDTFITFLKTGQQPAASW